MNKPVRTTTPAGEEIVILSAKAYDELVKAGENVRDAAIADVAVADWRAGRTEALSAKDMKALLAAPTPLVFWRKRRGLTQTALAETIGISQAYLAQIESAKRVGDVTLYARLAKRLGVGIEDLLPDGS